MFWCGVCFDHHPHQVLSGSVAGTLTKELGLTPIDLAGWDGGRSGASWVAAWDQGRTDLSRKKVMPLLEQQLSAAVARLPPPEL